MSSAAACRVPRPPGRSRAVASRWCCTKCGRFARPPCTRPRDFAELVCSNSFRSDDAESSAIGLLHAEMRQLGSLVMRTADDHKLPAGGALAVDRNGFAAAITAALEREPLVDIRREEISSCRRQTGTASSSPPAPHLTCARGYDPRTHRGRLRSLSSTRSRRSFTTIQSTSTSPGFNRATTRPARRAQAPTTSIAR